MAFRLIIYLIFIENIIETKGIISTWKYGSALGLTGKFIRLVL